MRETKTKLMKNQKGITLIALIITIIVLIILAGVAISMLSGENGILRKAAKSKTDTEEAQKVEEQDLVLQEAIIDYYNDEFPYTISSVGSYIYITGITVEYDGGNGCIVETVEQFKGKTNNKYSVWGDEGEVTDGSTNIATGMIVKNASTGTKVGTIIVYGDIYGEPGFDNKDKIFLTRFLRKYENLNFEDYQILAMDVNNDKIINQDDIDYISNVLVGGYYDYRPEQNRKAISVNELTIEYIESVE